MLYLNSLENQAASKTKNQYAICYESVPGMTNIVELTPSKELLRQWESKIIDWEEFRKRFTAELREEYSKGDKSRLKGLTKYSLENDVTLHSPEPPGEQTYRAILAEVINLIWQRLERTEQVIDLAYELVDERLTEADLHQMEEIAANCKSFTPTYPSSPQKSCRVCQHLDQKVFLCPETKRVVIDYKWIEPIWNDDQD